MCFICRVASGMSRLVFLECTGAEHQVPESCYVESGAPVAVNTIFNFNA